MTFLESVPNVSEGRDVAVVEAVADAFGGAGARVLDTHMDTDHHRSVMTLVGSATEIVDGLVAGVDEARRRIDLRHHAGVHPRVGVVDVVPVVPLDRSSQGHALVAGREVARRVGEELGLPVFLYALLGDGRRPVFFRRGGLDELRRRVDAGELDPDYGPREVGDRWGAVLVGVRSALVAFNVELRGSLATAREVAASVRESSGGLPGVQALGLELASGIVQVSTNVIDLDATALHEMVRCIEGEAVARGAGIARGELVGLLPARCVADAASVAGVGRTLDDEGLPTSHALEAAASLLHLDALAPDRVLEWHLAR